MTGPDAAFRWSLYLLASLWPVSVYAGARLSGSAACRPRRRRRCRHSWSARPGSATSTTHTVDGRRLDAAVGIATRRGLGVQLAHDSCGSHLVAAVAAVALTIALHFETGYLALLPLLLWPLVAGAVFRTHLCRGAIVIAGSLLAAAWAIVPLIAQRVWAARNELHGTALANGYGAGRVLGWLASGELLDHGRLPVLTGFAAIGLLAP